MAISLKSLFERRVPQIVGIYLGGSWAVVESVGWLVERLDASPVWVDGTAALLFSLLPAVVLIAFTHGRVGHQLVPTSEAIFVTLNLLFSGWLVYTIVRGPGVSVEQVQSETFSRRQVTFTGSASSPVFSPDGTRLAFLSSDSLETTLLLGDVGETTSADTLLSAGSISRLRWTGDGVLRVYLRDEEVGPWGEYRIDPVTGEPTFVGGWPYYASAPDGSGYVWTYQNYAHVMVVPSGPRGTVTETRHDLIGSRQWMEALHWAPAAPVVLVHRRGPEGPLLTGLNVDTGEQWEYVAAEWIHSVQFSPEGEVLYYAAPASAESPQATLFQIPLDSRTGRPTAPPEAIASVPGNVRLAPDGESLAYVVSSRTATVRWLDLSDENPYEESQVLAESSSSKGSLAVNPDGSTVAFWDYGSRSISLVYPDGRAKEEMAVVRREWPGAYPIRLSWSPSGQDVAALLTRAQSMREVVGIPLDPSGRAMVLAANVGDHLRWCSENRILVQDLGNREYSILTPTGDLTGKVFQDRATGWMFAPLCSPDGTEVAFEWNRNNPGLWVVNLETHRERHLVERSSNSSPYPVGWSPDGQWIYFYFTNMRPFGLFRIHSSGGDYQRVLDLPSSTSSLSMSADASKLATIEVHSQSDIWMIDNFRAEGGD